MEGNLDIAGQVIGGDVAGILIREKSGNKIELGDLLVTDEEGGYIILQVYDLCYGSQIPQSVRELAAGIKLEGYGSGLDFIDPKLRNYTLAQVKAVARVTKDTARIPKTLPNFFSSVRYLKEEDLGFLTKPSNPVYLGKVRSGSKIIDVEVFLNGEDFFTHHVLIPATTGRGKSNFVKVMLWSVLGQRKFGLLVLDPHDEYYGKNAKGLKDHLDKKTDLLYYSSDPPIGANTLVINLRSIEPRHFDGIVDFTDAQHDAITIYYRENRELWIEKIILGEQIEGIHPKTLSVLQRKFRSILGITVQEGEIMCASRVFSDSSGITTTEDIVGALESGKIVVVDTSNIGDEAELLIGSIVASKIFSKYQEYKSKGILSERPVVSIVIEEAPRVLGSDRLSTSGENIFSRIAREGRKFRVGLVAITQLTSVIPRTILTNLNTKIILGNEMATERHAIIESAAQDLAKDERNIASLDKGEAIVSSIFTRFAVPICIPLFEDLVKKANFDHEENGNIVFEE